MPDNEETSVFQRLTDPQVLHKGCYKVALPRTRPTKHPRTDIYRVRIRIPAPFRILAKERFGQGAEFIESLGTKDAALAKERAPAAWQDCVPAWHPSRQPIEAKNPRCPSDR